MNSSSRSEVSWSHWVVNIQRNRSQQPHVMCGFLPALLCMPRWFLSSPGGCGAPAIVFLYACSPAGPFTYLPFFPWRLRVQNQCPCFCNVHFWKGQTQAVLCDVLCIWSLAKMGVIFVRFPVEIILKPRRDEIAKTLERKKQNKTLNQFGVCQFVAF